MPVLLVLLGGGEALALFGHDMQNDRLFRVLDCAERLDHGGKVVAVRDKAVVQTHRAEQVALGLAAGFAQQAQIAVDAAVVLRDGHIVVIYDDDELAVQLGRVVERFERFAAGQRAVTDDCDDVAALAAQVTRLRQTAGEADRGRGVADGEVVVLALVRVAVTRNVVVVRRVEESLGSAGQHFVWIGLVRNVEHHPILRGVENVVQRDGRLDEAEVRAAVAAVAAELFDERGADFAAERRHFGERQLLDVCRAADVFQIHRGSSCLFSAETMVSL